METDDGDEEEEGDVREVEGGDGDKTVVATGWGSSMAGGSSVELRGDGLEAGSFADC